MRYREEFSLRQPRFFRGLKIRDERGRHLSRNGKPAAVERDRRIRTRCELIKRLDDLTYIRSATGTGHVGGHFRHNLDIVNNFLIGIAERRIDYNRRERDIRIETDREYAVEKLDL